MEDWEDLFQPHILERGYNYYQMDLVSNLHQNEELITATVRGSTDYDVRIKLDGGDVEDMFCDCPYAFKHYCKHMGAVLFAVAATAESSRTSSKISTKATSEPEKSLDELVNQAEDTVVRTFLLKLLKADGQLARRFRQTVSQEVTAADLSGYKMKVDQIISEHGGWEDFIDYNEAEDFAEDLFEMLENDVQQMVDNQAYQAAFELTNYIFLALGEIDIDDSDGYTSMLASVCYEIWEQLLEAADTKLKAAMLQWFSQQIEISALDYLQDYVEDIIREYFTEPEFLEKKLQLTNKKLQEAECFEGWQSEYLFGRWVGVHLETMEQLEKPPQEIEAIYKKYWRWNQVRKTFIKKCLAKQDYSRAIEVLQESIDLDSGSLGLIREYSEWLKDIYKETGQKEAYQQQLWQLLLTDAKGDLGAFIELKALYSPEEWRVVCEEIFMKLADVSTVDQLYLEEKRYDLLMAYIKKSQGLYKAIQYFGLLKESYPEALLDKFEKEIRIVLKDTQKRGKYREMAQLLRKMKTISGGNMRVADLVADLKKSYPRRSAMIEEFANL